MPIVPKTVPDLLDWATAHAPEWESAAASIGLSIAQADAFRDAAQAARDSVRAAYEAEQARKSATLSSQSAVAQLREVASETLAIIKAFAENQSAPANVYAAAQIPPQKSSSPTPPPGKPVQFGVSIDDNGYLALRWKCKNPASARGTLYEVRRKTSATSTFEFLGTTGNRKFTDTTLPAGSRGVSYMITAVRSTRRGESGQFNVNFGVDGGVAHTTKLAA